MVFALTGMDLYYHVSTFWNKEWRASIFNSEKQLHSTYQNLRTLRVKQHILKDNSLTSTDREALLKAYS